nr:MAG TPA: hypothetical protein [Caudoviricetes sp.]
MGITKLLNLLRLCNIHGYYYIDFKWILIKFTVCTHFILRNAYICT